MKKIFFLMLIALAVISCSKKSDNATETQYSNKLTLGTGFSTTNFFELTGVGTTFPDSTNIYFRLESADDMGGSAVRLIIEQQDGTPISSQDYPNPQSYGHILISNFSITRTGNYKATGILVTGLKTVATVDFTIN